ncbi:MULTISPECIES: HAD family hydrolase [unclassified Kitasatospora]|uniref:HAD family hydrolase n=1 Tax=unclassified Kitasatospora TaxID=2633591 RepID=UPI0024736B1B|nr:HAD family hydrolase [Kitasatospora sp. MAP12-44]
MPLLLLDLDNTLLPRDSAFQAWAKGFLSEYKLPPTEVDWLSTIDGGGYVPRSTVLGAAKRRYGLDLSMEFLLAHYRRGINSHIACPSSHIEALSSARTAGWMLAIVSNGGTGPQLEKIRRTGLAALVDAWVVSEEAGCAKPDPLIFEIAAQRCGISLSTDWTAQTWMVGDHAPADIAGAAAAGIRNVWLHHGRPWPELGYRPTLSARDVPEAVRMILAASSAQEPTDHQALGPDSNEARRTPPAGRTAAARGAAPLGPFSAPSAPSAPLGTPSTPWTGPAATATPVAVG